MDSADRIGGLAAVLVIGTMLLLTLWADEQSDRILAEQKRCDQKALKEEQHCLAIDPRGFCGVVAVAQIQACNTLAP